MKRVLTFEFDGTDIESDNYDIDTLNRAQDFRRLLHEVYNLAREQLKYGDASDKEALTETLDIIRATAFEVID